MNHPYAELIGLEFEDQDNGRTVCSLTVEELHYNPHRVVHGAVLYSLADSGMGAAVYPTLEEGEICATVEIKINYYKPVSAGKIRCVTELVHRGKRVANLDSSLYVGEKLVAKANGTYSIFRIDRGSPSGQ